jgi:hypothetical protein
MPVKYTVVANQVKCWIVFFCVSSGFRSHRPDSVVLQRWAGQWSSIILLLVQLQKRFVLLQGTIFRSTSYWPAPPLEFQHRGHLTGEQVLTLEIKLNPTSSTCTYCSPRGQLGNILIGNDLLHGRLQML